MGGRQQNVEDPITWTRDKRKTKFDMLGFFWPTLYIYIYMLYLDYNPNHPVHCKDSIPYRQALRVVGRCSTPEDRDAKFE